MNIITLDDHRVDMAKVLPFHAGCLTMSSREISELTGKEHKHVIRDIRAMLAELSDGPDLDHVAETKDSRGYTAEIALPKDLTLTLVAGYNVKLRKRIIDRWMELEKQLAAPRELSRIELIHMALQSEEARLQVEQQNQQLIERIEEEAPLVAFTKKVEAAPDAISVAQAAKIIGTGQRRLFAFLRQIGWITRRNEPYQAKIEAGYLDVKLGSWDHPDHGLQQSVTALVTGKGLVKLQKLWSDGRQTAAV